MSKNQTKIPPFKRTNLCLQTWLIEPSTELSLNRKGWEIILQLFTCLRQPRCVLTSGSCLLISATTIWLDEEGQRALRKTCTTDTSNPVYYSVPKRSCKQNSHVNVVNYADSSQSNFRPVSRPMVTFLCFIEETSWPRSQHVFTDHDNTACSSTLTLCLDWMAWGSRSQLENTRVESLFEASDEFPVGQGLAKR